jgi:hypothetical protein
VELLLPGGTLIALLIWLFRHRSELGLQRSSEGKVIDTGSLAGKVASSA